MAATGRFVAIGTQGSGLGGHSVDVRFKGPQVDEKIQGIHVTLRRTLIFDFRVKAGFHEQSSSEKPVRFQALNCLSKTPLRRY